MRSKYIFCPGTLEIYNTESGERVRVDTDGISFSEVSIDAHHSGNCEISASVKIDASSLIFDNSQGRSEEFPVTDDLIQFLMSL